MDIPPIQSRYLLVLEIPVYRDQTGTYWTNPLWHKDLLEHLSYIEDFTMACPRVDIDDIPEDMVRLDGRIKVVGLPSRHKVSLKLPITAWRLWKAIRDADIVHTALGGWFPLSICNMTSFMAHARKRFLFIVVESSAWRLIPGAPASFLARFKADLAEWIHINCLKRVNFAIFTHQQYKESLLVNRAERGHVIHASWIDQDIILSPQSSQQAWTDKLAAPAFSLKILFAGRLTEAKGVLVLLDAMRKLDMAGHEIELSILGQGELLKECQAAQAALQHARIKVLEPIVYGPEFFEFLKTYHAVLIPSITEEQPRIVYDAFSQAVPALACDTAGLRDCIEDGVTGKLCKLNDVDALAELITWASQHPQELSQMGANALLRTTQMTHQHMHQKRWALLNQVLHTSDRTPAAAGQKAEGKKVAGKEVA